MSEGMAEGLASPGLSLAALASWFGADSPPFPLLLLLAFGLEAALGGDLLRFSGHPERLLGSAARFLEGRLNRAERSERTRLVRGAVALAAIVVVAGATGALVHTLSTGIAYGWLTELALLALFLGMHRPLARGLRVERALRQGQPEEAQRSLGPLAPPRGAARSMDAHALARRAVEDCAEGLKCGVVGAAFWALILGVPGLMAYRALNALAQSALARGADGAAFGCAASRVLAAANFIPSHLAGLIASLGAVAAPKGKPAAALRAAFTGAPLPEATFAAALDLSLLAPSGGGWIGSGRARALPSDVARALVLYLAACLLVALTLAVLSLARAIAGP